ncbi:adenine nucleotide alpha hydrolases-like protein [Rhizoclosmatium globosum]|uniref:Adenine nucleotide alpha hydrolases-like protein n=1 Tax=Rhizoclosmatium globosum TaxID=329046 RepID=A0A1Y2BKC7_9FUNG|nr:adenine nucleotide alpha hydrolases-like protein [Rhizoclosmatium globosum]|eukprot:ORY35221.1 adenine nucleotide alpha hydrolases-like protein [Rhizoclosmatium globosum]
MTADIQASEPSTPEKRIIAIALDASKFSDYAFHWALDHYLRPSDHVLLLNVQQHASAYIAGNILIHDPFTPVDTTTSLSPKDESHALLARYVRILESKKSVASFKAVSIHPSYVSIKESIVREVAVLKATVLIVGSRGLDGMSRGFLGSVSDYCAHHCHCPVVIVRPSEEDVKKFGTSFEVAAMAARGPF